MRQAAPLAIGGAIGIKNLVLLIVSANECRGAATAYRGFNPRVGRPAYLQGSGISKDFPRQARTPKFNTPNRRQSLILAYPKSL
jgi:hypothetical protein